MIPYPASAVLRWVLLALLAGGLTVLAIHLLGGAPRWLFLLGTLVMMALASAARPANILKYATKQTDDRGDIS